MPTGKTWRFRHWIYRGVAYIDDYREFNTSGLSWTPDERMGFTYDALDRLVGASPVNGGQGYNQSYSYNEIGNLTTKTGLGAIAYLDTAHRHAATHIGTPPVQKYWYDANGNMLTRVENGVSYTQGWDQENRLQTVTVNGATTTFTYDGDGALVKKTVGITTTYYVNGGYEKTGSVVTKYYAFGSQRVAMRVCTGANGSCATSTLTYLHADHLGSASLATCGNTSWCGDIPVGGKVSEMRYYPYGETRSGAMTTDRQYTGQRREIGLGLYDYNARYYDPLLGRFLSADSIVPSPANPQSLNRYAYALNNPLRYTDPTGHFENDQIREWLKRQYPDTWESIWKTWLQDTAWMDWLHTAQWGDIGAYLKPDGDIQWFMFGNLLYGCTLASLHDTEIKGVISLVDLYAGMWATGVLRRNNSGGYEVLKTDKTGRLLHMSEYISIDSTGEARAGHYTREIVLALPSLALTGIIGWSDLAAQGWQKFLGISEKAFKGLAVAAGFTSFLAATETDFIVPDDGCSVGDEAVYFEVAWGNLYVLPNGKPSWLWWNVWTK